jgi:hypothetical protein
MLGGYKGKSSRAMRDGFKIGQLGSPAFANDTD